MSRFYKSGTNRFLNSFIFQPNYELKSKLIEQEAKKEALKNHFIKGFNYIETFRGWQDDADAIINEINEKKIRPIAEKLKEDPNNPEYLNDLYKTVYEIRKEMTSGELGDMINKYKVYKDSKKEYEDIIKKEKNLNLVAEHKSKLRNWENYIMNQVGTDYNENSDIYDVVPYYDPEESFKDIKTENLKYTIEQIRRGQPFIIKDNKAIFQKDWNKQGLKISGNGKIIDSKGNEYEIGQTPTDFVRLKNLPFNYERIIDTKEGFYTDVINAVAKQKLLNSEAYLKSVAQDYKFGRRFDDNDTLEDYINKRAEQDASAFSDRFPETTKITEKPEYKVDEFGKSVALENLKYSHQRALKKAEEDLSTVYSFTGRENMFDPKYVNEISDKFFELWTKKISNKKLTPQQEAEYDRYENTFKSFLGSLSDTEIASINAYFNYNKKPEYKTVTLNGGDGKPFVTQVKKPDKDLIHLKRVYESIKDKFKKYVENIPKDKQVNYTAISYPVRVEDKKGNMVYTRKDAMIANKMDSELFQAITSGKYSIYSGFNAHGKPIYGGLSSAVEGAKNVAGNSSGNPLLDIIESSNITSIEQLFEPHTYSRFIRGGKVYVKGKIRQEAIDKADNSYAFNGLRNSDNQKVSNYVTIDLGEEDNDFVSKAVVGNNNVEEEYWNYATHPELDYVDKVTNETLASITNSLQNLPLQSIIDTPNFKIDGKKYHFQYDKKNKIFKLLNSKNKVVNLNGKTEIPSNLLKSFITAIILNPNILKNE